MTQKEIKKLLKPGVKLKETYISWLIFTGGFVYKIKKPVNYGYLDFSSLAKRKFFLEEELRLNKRLSGEIYFDVVPIVERGGRLKAMKTSFSSSTFVPTSRDSVLDYALKMKEIPEKYYAPALLKKGKLKKEAVKKIAKIVAAFHQKAQTSPEIEEYGTLKIISKNCEENFSQMKPYVGKVVSKSLYEFITKETRYFLKENKNLFLKRIKQKEIRDCHGDLHTGNIFVSPRRIYIIDCIEFNKRFRYQDTASDAAFLAMDFDYLERPDLANYFVAQYEFESKDADLSKILPFYKCYRAYVRAKVGCFSLPRSDVYSIQRYFSLAFKYAFEFSRKKPFLLVFCGEIGSGKSYLAEYISRITSARLIKSDVIRKELLGIPLFEHRKKGLEKIYSREVTIRVYKKMLLDALKLLRQGQPVILDATFPTEFYRQMIIKPAEKGKIPYVFVECWAPEKKVLRRLKERVNKKEISDATVQVYLQLKGKFERIGLPSKNYIFLNREKGDVEGDANKVLKKALNL